MAKTALTVWTKTASEDEMRGKRRKSMTAAQKEAIRLHADEQTKILAAHDKLWRERWDRAPNPFAAWADWMSPEFCAERKRIIGPWRAAVDARNEMTAGKKK